MKYARIHEHRDSFPVAVQCEVLEVSASGYYDWLDRPPSPRAKRHEQIQAAVRQVHAESYGIYGSLKIANTLRERPDLESASRNTVAQAMRELGLKSRIANFKVPRQVYLVESLPFHSAANGSKLQRQILHQGAADRTPQTDHT